MSTLRVLRWLIVGRLTLAAGIFAGALGVWQSAPAQTTMVATLALVGALMVTLYALWRTDVLRRPASVGLVYGQVVFDVVLVTAVVHITTLGGPSDFSPLYILVIVAGSLLLPLPGGMLTGALAALLYLADMLWLQPLPPSSGAYLQVALYAVLAMVTAALGSRLRRAGTELGVVESELRQLRLDTSEILDAIDTGLLTVDGSGVLVHMNGAGQGLLGIDEEVWRGREVLDELDRVAPGLGGAVRRTWEERAPIRRHELHIIEATRDRYIGLRTTILEREGAPWVTAVFQDITEGKQIERTARRVERLEAVAELAASLAHEIKNPLASIRSAVEQLAGDRLDERDRGVLRRLVVAESNRLSVLLADFMEFSRLELRRSRSVDLVELVMEAIGVVSQHPDAGAGQRIEFDRPAEPVSVGGDRDVLHRALFNLLLNGVQHVGQGGVVRVELASVGEADLPAGMEVGAGARLVVSDTGPGIQDEDVPRVFDPFFTTRDGGTGLGLALVHRAVEAHRGAILVDGMPGVGARFTVFLPFQSNGSRS